MFFTCSFVVVIKPFKEINVSDLVGGSLAVCRIFSDLVGGFQTLIEFVSDLVGDSRSR